MTELQPNRHYVCPSGGGYGHSSRYTGSQYQPHPGDELCNCGQPLVEEDDERWAVSFEYEDPDNPGVWHPVYVVRSRHAAHEQFNGLANSMDGIRNAKIRQLVADEIHISNPALDDAGWHSFCGQPVTLITRERDPRPICHRCYIGIMGNRADEIQRLTNEWERAADQLEAVKRVAQDQLGVISEGLRGGDHAGPCLNYEDQDPGEYSEWDSCYLHVETSGQRHDAAVSALELLRGVLQ